jgi:hypothetical protein
VKVKIPLLDLWLVSGRRLKAGYGHRYEQGYLEGWAAGSAAAEETHSSGWSAVEAALHTRVSGNFQGNDDRLAG